MFQELILGISLTRQLTGSKYAHMNTVSGMFFGKHCLKAKELLVKFDFHESVHHDIITKTTNKMQLCRLIYYSLSGLLVSGDVFAHRQEHLTVFTVSGSVHQCRCRNTTRCCKYSQMLLTMGENIARNM